MSLNYILRRLGTLVLVLFGVSVLTFAIMPLVPGSPARVKLGIQATPENVAALEKKLGLDRPLVSQYGDWITGIVTRFDFGNSLISDKPITAEVARRLPATLQLAIVALLIGLLIALPAGIMAALKPGSFRDVSAMVFSQIGVSIPDFWMGILLIVFFAEYLQWLPSSGFVPLSEPTAIRRFTLSRLMWAGPSRSSIEAS